MKYQIFKPIILVGLSLALAACGGDEDTTKRVQGTLVAPKASAKVIAKVLQKAEGVKFKDECPNVPAGYSPLKKVTVEFLDSASVAKGKTTTDECGNFSASVPNEVTKVKAKSSGNKDLVVEVSVLQSTGASALASTIPSNAEYQISSIQMRADDKVAFSVTDTISNNAVLGVPESAISVSINEKNVHVLDISNAAHVADPASITLVMDASGSMGYGYNNIRKENGEFLFDADGKQYSRFRMAALAAHTYLDNMPSSDETGLVVFNNEVDFINDATISELFTLTKDNGDATEYKFSITGYTNDTDKLRFLIDAYNPFTEIYSNYFSNSHEKLHIKSPNLKSAKYPWLGNTAVYDGILKGLEETKKRPNSRKVVIALTDGENNRGERDENIVIQSAIDKNIPVYTIALGTKDAANKVMKKIADSTNASFFKVTGTDLVSAFQSIQTGITFQYLVNLNDSAKVGDVVNFTLNYNGETASREVIR